MFCVFLYYLCLCYKIGLYNVMGFFIFLYFFIVLDLMMVNDCIVCFIFKIGNISFNCFLFYR